jgi:dynein heavy chain
VLSLLSQGKSVEVFKDSLNELKAKLNRVDTVMNIWGKVQKNWKRLVNIFLLSDDIRNQLQEATKLFDQKNAQFREIMADVQLNPIIIEACTDDKRVELEEISKSIEDCEKKLNIYLEQKKKAFARFYFVSNQTLIDILSNGNNPLKIADEFLGDLFDGIKKLTMRDNPANKMACPQGVAMVSKDGEVVPFKTPFEPKEEVEIWLSSLEAKMRDCLQDVMEEAKVCADENLNSPEVKEEAKMDWINKFCAQISLVTVQITWTDDVHKSFDDIEGGMSNAMKDCFEGIKKRIGLLISKVRSPTLTKELRDKIITIITIDVHSRDVVEKLLLKNIVDKESFQWYSQLKFYWSRECQDVVANQAVRHPWERNADKSKCIIRIIDWAKFYSHEYVGNCGRLVITPLTDRCYITLTQALSLNMGGAPAGPAGTGKTETTKDLGRAVGLPVFVFNCSEQMNTDSLGQIFMGLSQTGAWGCFDEFNRISIEVLSVVSTQVKQVLDALNESTRRGSCSWTKRSGCMDTVGFFITMNPGYAGRTELPENLKALFRYCAMVVPDLILICENMLMSEGYNQARELAKKFVTLYDLSKSLLSKQKHYDWGLRAVKSVLRQAGKLKRSNESMSEELLLFGALKDFNLPKIVTDDKPIFINLLKDLFTEVEKVPETVIDEPLKALVTQKALELSYIPEEMFCLKCIQLSEILEVRHCVFIIGPTGSGKSAVWKTLAAANKDRGLETEYDCLDPKAVSSDELFGTLSKTKEFKNGVLSSIIKFQCKEMGKYKPHHKMKWAILDGDIDPEWIESLNTVMDDNKVLTLVSNDRFPLTPSMRLVFEISNLKFATPATASRAGVLFINETDIGWKPFFDSWLESHKKETLSRQLKDGKALAKIEFDPLAVAVFLKCQAYVDNPEIQRLTHVIPTCDMMMIETTTTIIDGLTVKNKALLEGKKEEELKLALEGIFLYAAMWGFGGTFLDSGEDEVFYKEFVRIWKGQAKIKYPEVQQGDGKLVAIFDFFFDVKSLSWVQYEVPVFAMPDDVSFTKLFVSTIYTQRLWDLLELHVGQKKPIMFAGNAGTGKTHLINQFISGLPGETYLKNTVNFSSKTSSGSLQENIIQSGLSKLGMRLWGLGSGRSLVFFVDDINMPYVDKYATQAPIALIRQILDYGIVYDRDNLEEYNRLQDIYFCACLNPKSGSFNIEPRLQRHFSTFCLPIPNETIIKQIYRSILTSHFSQFDDSYSQMADKVVDSTVLFFSSIVRDTTFNPSAKKFHYQFNLRELSKVTEGVMQASVAFFRGRPQMVAKLWIHECKRVFQDRLVNEEDVKKLGEYLGKAYGLFAEGHLKLTDQERSDIFAEHNIFTSFISLIQGESEKVYLPITSMDDLKAVLVQKMEEYNESKAQMDLVLFNVALMHITRISRILDRSNGHGLLVGVGGSGKQSLTKLASFLQNYDLEMLPMMPNFNPTEFKAFIGDLLKKATKPPGTNRILMITDSQITSEDILVFINDLLNNGYIPGLWPRDELEGHLQTLKNEAKALNFSDSPESLFSYFVEKIRRNVHLILCMSPVGDTLRIRARKFPGLINGTMINWFHGWPKDALYDVAYSFLKSVEFPPIEGIVEKLSENMSETHNGIEEMNRKFLQQESRYNYTTPKSYLELIEFYKQKLSSKRKDVDSQIYSLQNGLRTLEETQNKVKGLEEELRVIMVDVRAEEEGDQRADRKGQLREGNRQQGTGQGQRGRGEDDRAGWGGHQIKERAEKAFTLAKPKLENAQEALLKLSESKISIMKNLKSPPAAVVLTGKVVIYMFKGEKVDLFSDKDNESSWKKAVNVMNNVKRFLIDLKAFSNETAKNLDPVMKDNVKKLIASGNFNVNDVTEVSSAAGNLADWAHNIIEFNEAFNIVKPLEEEKNKAEEVVRVKNKELEVVKEKVRLLVEKVASLEKKLQEAEEQERKVEAERATYQRKLDASEKLVKGLSGENKRWTQSVEELQVKKLTVIGDTLLAAEFVSYVAPFTSKFRYTLWHDLWIPDIVSRKIPITDGITPLQILTKNSEMAKWKNEGLPEDEMSLQNATIITNCARWPLMIDPQLQGVNWLKGHYLELQSSSEGKAKGEEKAEEEASADQSNDFVRLSMNGKNAMAQLQMAISYGKKVLIENVAEELDSNLEPLLARNIVKKSTTLYITIGADQIEYNPKFKLYLQCKLQNPHFRPEIAAQCTIINFIVTEKGLEDQLLAMVVNFERQELETKRQELVRQQNDFEVKLSMLEETLLESLSSANPETILDNTELIDNLDNMKRMSMTIEVQKEEGKVTEKRINEEREKYRVVASEGSMLFFLIISLVIVDHMYQYSLESFIIFFFKAMRGVTVDDDSRVKELVLNIRFIIYQWIARGLFERHKIIFMSMLAFRLMQKQIVKVDWNQQMMQFLLNCVPKADTENPLKEWLPNSAWFSVQRMAEIEEFRKLPESMEKEFPGRFKDWFNELAPENSRLPSDWRKLDAQPFLKLCVIRALRPDRMSVALVQFIKSVLPRGIDFVSMDQNLSFNDILMSAIEDATQETSMNTPIFFILSTGADPVKEVEKIGKRMKFEANLNNFFNIALGQGQDKYADSKLEAGFRDGYWIMLQNIHLMPSWLPSLEKRLDQFSKEDGCHPNFRLFLSAEPSRSIPVGILERTIKLTNEPPAGLKANMKRAWTYFPRDEIDEKDTKYNHILFALCYFHSVLIERRKFGSKGWNMFYPFSIGDLRDSYSVLCKNAEVNTSGKIPWADLKYIFGEIMYGGHIVDDWDRKLCNGYLEYLLEPGLISEDFELYPFVEGKKNSLKMPPTNSKFQMYLEQIESEITEETPIAYGLHPNAEIGLGISQCNYIFTSLIDLLPKDSTAKADEGASGSRNQEVYSAKILNDYALREKMFNIADIKDRIVEKGAFQNVFLQECEYMNGLLDEIHRSMLELEQGIKGILTISEKMENLLEALNLEKIPENWQKLAYPARRSLASWLENLMRRIEQLSTWKDDPMNIPRVTRVNMLFNPQSFFTAIKQYSKKGDLNKLTISTEFTKKTIEEVDGVVPKDGAYCYGFLLEGARWDWQLGVVEDSRPKEMFSVMPVCFCRAVFLPPPGREEKNVYQCPVYRTEERGSTFIFTAQLKTSPKNPPRKWILAGVAIILDVEDVSDEVKKEASAK